MATKPRDTPPDTAGGAMRANISTAEERRAGAAAMGRARTPAKGEAARVNGRKAPPGPGRTPKPLEAFPCTCGRGDALEGHPTTCPRGRTIWRRRKAGTL